MSFKPRAPQESYWALSPQSAFLRTTGVVALGLVAILTLAVWAYSSPAMWLVICRADVLPAAERALEFRFGDVRVPGEPRSQRGFLDVAQYGPLSRAGVRAGDIPIDHHGGESAFCGALRSAAEGEPCPLYVLHATDWADGRTRLRKIVVPAYRPD